jgi:hypothetical protein
LQRDGESLKLCGGALKHQRPSIGRQARFAAPAKLIWNAPRFVEWSPFVPITLKDSHLVNGLQFVKTPARLLVTTALDLPRQAQLPWTGPPPRSPGRGTLGKNRVFFVAKQGKTPVGESSAAVKIAGAMNVAGTLSQICSAVAPNAHRVAEQRRYGFWHHH